MNAVLWVGTFFVRGSPELTIYMWSQKEGRSVGANFCWFTGYARIPRTLENMSERNGTQRSAAPSTVQPTQMQNRGSSHEF